MLSDEFLTSLETGERSAIEARGQFLVTIEDALPREVAGTSEVAKKITESVTVSVAPSSGAGFVW